MRYRFFICALIMLAGCGSYPKPNPKTTIDFCDSQTVIYGANTNQKEILYQAILRLPPKMRRAVEVAVVCWPTNYDHMRATQLDNELAAGHAHLEAHAFCLRDKTLRDGNWAPEAIWHEAGHLYTATLTSGAIKEWQEIAGQVYTCYKDRNKSIADYPARGLLTSYASSNYDEDIAEFVREAYGYIYFYRTGGLTELSMFNQLSEGAPDPRYEKKIGWMKRWGYLRAEHAEQILRSPLILQNKKL